jgi:hypothetical protein
MHHHKDAWKGVKGSRIQLEQVQRPKGVQGIGFLKSKTEPKEREPSEQEQKHKNRNPLAKEGAP